MSVRPAQIEVIGIHILRAYDRHLFVADTYQCVNASISKRHMLGIKKIVWWWLGILEPCPRENGFSLHLFNAKAAIFVEVVVSTTILVELAECQLYALSTANTCHMLM